MADVYYKNKLTIVKDWEKILNIIPKSEKKKTTFNRKESLMVIFFDTLRIKWASFICQHIFITSRISTIFKGQTLKASIWDLWEEKLPVLNTFIQDCTGVSRRFTKSRK